MFKVLFEAVLGRDMNLCLLDKTSESEVLCAGSKEIELLVEPADVRS